VALASTSAVPRRARLVFAGAPVGLATSLIPIRSGRRVWLYSVRHPWPQSDPPRRCLRGAAAQM